MRPDPAESLSRAPSPPESTAAAAIPEQLGSFPIERELGRGGMGVVYLARDPRLDRRVALKTLPAELALDPQRLAQFQREAKVLASLNHPNIATIHGFEADDRGSRFLILEWVNGTTLAERLESGPLALDESFQVLTQIAAALLAAHEAEIVHRDLKPRNVMLLPGQRVKVLDFGLARRTATVAEPSADQHESTATRSRLTGVDGSHVLLGTAAYMSPERILGDPEDQRGDIFAFGCVAYECLSGKPAFQGSGVLGILTRVVRAEPDWDALPPETPAELRTLLTSCLEKAPGARPASMEVILRTLERVRERRLAPRTIPPPTRTPHNLPKAFTSFIGRDREIAECWRQLMRTPLLTLAGAGGCGKTRLALRVAEGALDQGWDGVWLVALAPVQDPAHLASAVVRVLGLAERADRPALATLVEHLAERRELIVLDNCEHVLAGAAELTRALTAACPRITVLATSREPLGIPGESVFPVSPMAVPGAQAEVAAAARQEAVRLFTERARDADAAFELTRDNLAAVCEICRRVDGIPLAIELAAARVRVLAPAEIASRLDRQLRLLTSDAAPLAQRHQTLRQTIRWSVDLLSPEEQAAFRTLSAFVGGWDLEAATAVLELTDDFEVLDLIGRLVNRSLLIAERRKDEPTRYRYLEPIRQAAVELLAESADEGRTRDRHLDYFLTLTRTARPLLVGKDEHRWLDRLEAEHQNALAAIEWAARSSRAEAAQELASNLGRFWLVRGRIALGMATLERVIALPAGAAPTWGRAQALYTLSAIGHVIMDPRRALDLLREAKAIFEQAGDRLWTARCLATLGAMCTHHQRGDEAVQWFKQAEIQFRDLGDLTRLDHAGVVANLGSLAWEREDHAQAMAYFAQSLALCRECGELATVARTATSLAFLTRRAGDPERARVYAREALAAVLTLKARDTTAAGALLAAAELAAASADYEIAGRLFAASDALLEQIGVTFYAGTWLGQIDAWRRSIQENLGASEVARLTAEARAMPLEQVVAMALGSVGG